MHIIAIEGLSLTGKTTVGKALMEHYKKEGKSCIYREKGRLTGRYASDPFYIKALECIRAWDLTNHAPMRDFIHHGFQGMVNDYSRFQNTAWQYQHVDIMILDRHFTDQYVTAEYFGYTFDPIENKLKNYLEIGLFCNYGELLRRSKIRNDNHGKLTDYTLSNQKIHDSFQALYSKYIRTEHQINNTEFDAFQRIRAIVDKRL